MSRKIHNPLIRNGTAVSFVTSFASFPTQCFSDQTRFDVCSKYSQQASHNIVGDENNISLPCLLRNFQKSFPAGAAIGARYEVIALWANRQIKNPVRKHRAILT